MPDSSRICGVPMAPAHSTVSRTAFTATSSPPFTTSAPLHTSSPLALRSMIKFLTCAWVHTVKLGRFMMGRKKALDVFHRQPLRWFTSK